MSQKSELLHAEKMVKAGIYQNAINHGTGTVWPRTPSDRHAGYTAPSSQVPTQVPQVSVTAQAARA